MPAKVAPSAAVDNGDDEHENTTFTAPKIYLAILVWLSSATAFYHHYNGWTVATSFYYACEAGLSVGFGALTEPDDVSRMYTIIHVILGSSFIGGALGLVMQIAVDRCDELRENLRTNAVMGKSVEQQRISKLEMVTSCASRLRYKLMDPRVRFNVGFACCLCLGIIFSCVHWKTSFVTGLYFAVTGLSTGGLFAPPQLDDTSMWVTGFFVLIGVPLYGTVLGGIGSMVVEPYVEAQFRARMKDASSLDIDEFLEATSQGGDDKCQYGEYLEFCMRHAYHATPEQIQELRDRFNAMDTNGDGSISKNEVEALEQLKRKTASTSHKRAKTQSVVGAAAVVAHAAGAACATGAALAAGAVHAAGDTAAAISHAAGDTAAAISHAAGDTAAAISHSCPSECSQGPITRAAGNAAGILHLPPMKDVTQKVRSVLPSQVHMPKFKR